MNFSNLNVTVSFPDVRLYEVRRKGLRWQVVCTYEDGITRELSTVRYWFKLNAARVALAAQTQYLDGIWMKELEATVTCGICHELPCNAHGHHFIPIGEV